LTIRHEPHANLVLLIKLDQRQLLFASNDN
jgi:hypothetical protein